MLKRLEIPVGAFIGLLAAFTMNHFFYDHEAQQPNMDNAKQPSAIHSSCRDCGAIRA